MNIKTQLEQNYITICTKNIEQGDSVKDQADELQQQISNLDKDISTLLLMQKSFYNPKWGRVFRAGAEESYFAYQVDRFACIYMEKLADLLAHSPLTYFRAKQRKLAHDVSVHLENE